VLCPVGLRLFVSAAIDGMISVSLNCEINRALDLFPRAVVNIGGHYQLKAHFSSAFCA
jgi:hypothetical protein